MTLKKIRRSPSLNLCYEVLLRTPICSPKARTLFRFSFGKGKSAFAFRFKIWQAYEIKNDFGKFLQREAGIL